MSIINDSKLTDGRQRMGRYRLGGSVIWLPVYRSGTCREKFRRKESID